MTKERKPKVNSITTQEDSIEETNQNDSEISSDSKKKKLNRRGFLAAGTGAAAAIVTSNKSFAAPAGPVIQAKKATQKGKSQIPSTSPNFGEPKPVTSLNNQVSLTLDVESNNTWSYVCNGTRTTTSIPLTVYEQGIPGPTIFADPGDRLNITLNNRLTGANPWTGDTCVGHNTHSTSTPPKPLCFMHTNLHTHGLLVSPCSIDNTGKTHCGPYNIDGTNPPLRSSSDDVLIDIFPGQSNNYCIDIPSFHDPGTYWYHSHLHGASGYQVSSGMAGALIIRDPVDKQMVDQNLDRVWIMQEVYTGPTPNPLNLPPVYGSLGSGSGRPQTQFFLNGLCQPTIQIYKNQMQRWRFINATGTPQGLMKLRMIKCGSTCPTAPPFPAPSASDPVMYLISVDGLAFYGFAPVPVQQHLMGAGNRADFLVKFSEPGTYILLKDSFPQDATSISASATPVAASSKSTQVLGYVQVIDSPYYNDKIPSVVPGSRPFYLQAINSVSNSGNPRVVQFQNQNGGFQINNAFYPNNAPINVRLNTAEEWVLDNTIGGNTHPFHIHVNPFQIVGRTYDFESVNSSKSNPADPCNWLWSDTLSLPMVVQGSTNGKINIRTRFLVYPGEFVVHCHILIHEDVGMMINVVVNDDGNGVGPCVPLSTPPQASINCVNSTTKSCNY